MKRSIRLFHFHRLNPAGNRLFRSSDVAAQAEKSNLPSEFSHTTFEGFRNLCKGFKGNLLFRPFDVTNVVPREISLFRQLFLAQTSLLPLDADGFPQNAVNFARR